MGIGKKVTRDDIKKADHKGLVALKGPLGPLENSTTKDLEKALAKHIMDTMKLGKEKGIKEIERRSALKEVERIRLAEDASVKERQTEIEQELKDIESRLTDLTEAKKKLNFELADIRNNRRHVADHGGTGELYNKENLLKEVAACDASLKAMKAAVKAADARTKDLTERLRGAVLAELERQEKEAAEK